MLSWEIYQQKACALDRDLADFKVTISHIPYNTGLVPTKWKQGVGVMLHKKQTIIIW
jgi:hypothetical protein